jgi:hypothetical protein
MNVTTATRSGETNERKRNRFSEGDVGAGGRKAQAQARQESQIREEDLARKKRRRLSPDSPEAPTTSTTWFCNVGIRSQAYQVGFYVLG